MALAFARFNSENNLIFSQRRYYTRKNTANKKIYTMIDFYKVYMVTPRRIELRSTG